VKNVVINKQRDVTPFFILQNLATLHSVQLRPDIGKVERKRPLSRPRCRLLDNLKMDLRGRERDGIDWTDLAQDRGQWRALVKTLMNFRIP
jgi:hypothetical protein